MEKSKVSRWILAGAIGAALLITLALSRRAGPSSMVSPDGAQTVPPQLTAADASPLATTSPSEMVVYVAGAVRRPSVYRLPPGTRVADAVERAGGASTDADLERINLAQPLTDAMEVDVPHKGQFVADSTDHSARRAGRSHGSHRRGSSSHKLSAGQTLDINTATADELTQLPGVGPSLAQRIVDYREQNGPFATVDDLQNVPGIGASKFDKLEPFVRL